MTELVILDMKHNDITNNHESTINSSLHQTINCNRKKKVVTPTISPIHLADTETIKTTTASLKRKRNKSQHYLKEGKSNFSSTRDASKMINGNRMETAFGQTTKHQNSYQEPSANIKGQHSTFVRIRDDTLTNEMKVSPQQEIRDHENAIIYENSRLKKQLHSLSCLRIKIKQKQHEVNMEKKSVEIKDAIQKESLVHSKKIDEEKLYHDKKIKSIMNSVNAYKWECVTVVNERAKECVKSEVSHTNVINNIPTSSGWSLAQLRYILTGIMHSIDLNILVSRRNFKTYKEICFHAKNF